LRLRPARRAALTMTFIRADCSMMSVLYSIPGLTLRTERHAPSRIAEGRARVISLEHFRF
jgi:hypothetical protein